MWKQDITLMNGHTIINKSLLNKVVLCTKKLHEQ